MGLAGSRGVPPLVTTSTVSYETGKDEVLNNGGKVIVGGLLVTAI